MTIRSLAILAALALAPTGVAAQDAASEATVALRADCRQALPSDLAAALELELQERVVLEGDADVVVRVTTPCERGGRELVVVVETRSGARLGPLHLDVVELGPRIRGRMAAVWVAEHVRLARGDVGAVDAASEGAADPVARTPAMRLLVEPASGLGAPALTRAGVTAAPAGALAAERARMLVRGDLALALHHDIVVGGVGPGADLRVELGTRGRPGVALELGIGGAGIAASTEDSWTELRASLGGLLDVMLDHDWGAAFGVRLLFVHEVFTGARMDASSISPYRIEDALDIRAAAFATGRLYVHEGLSVIAEVELGVLLFSFFPSWYTVGREQNLVQGVLRIGVGID